jgi:dihydroorotate dehydrogenase
MGIIYRNLVRPVFFRLDPEDAHERTVRAMAILSAVPPARALLRWRGSVGVDAGPVRVFGVDFPNRVGVAAGFDKNAVCWRAMAALGFGHVEVGTVTLHAQPGNERPRLFRYPEEQAVINRMGFNNEGAEAVARRLRRGPRAGRRRTPLGINLGKSKITPIDEAVEDYLGSFRLLADHADYVAINVSSPNTPDLRKLQDEARVRELLEALRDANRDRGTDSRPIVLR